MSTSPANSTRLRCPRCSTEFGIPYSEAKGQCPHCYVRMTLTPGERIPAGGASSGGQTSPADASNTSAPSERPSETETFATYLREHFERSRGLAVWGIVAGLVAVPLMSLSKPVLGIGGILTILKITVAVTVLAGLWYVFERFQAFALKQRGLTDENDRDWPAAFVYGCAMFLVPVVLLSIAECFTPPRGLVASLVPGAREEPAIPASGSQRAVALAPHARLG
ncbi:MAG: hypothetical protein HUU20_26565, partial [Pirellulales bacterium]|nr:hypothetical protein [Pirellulales bacterium]